MLNNDKKEGITIISINAPNNREPMCETKTNNRRQKQII